MIADFSWHVSTDRRHDMTGPGHTAAGRDAECSRVSAERPNESRPLSPTRLLMSDGGVKHLRVAAHAVHDDATGGTEYVGAVLDVIAAEESRQALEKAYAEIQELKERLQSETTGLREEI